MFTHASILQCYVRKNYFGRPLINYDVWNQRVPISLSEFSTRHYTLAHVRGFCCFLRVIKSKELHVETMCQVHCITPTSSIETPHGNSYTVRVYRCIVIEIS